MAILARKTMFQFPQRNVRGGLTNELWHVYAAPDNGDESEDPTGIVSPELIFTTGYAQGLPQVGDVHPTATLGLCTGGRVSQVIAKHSVLVLVSYQSYGLYNGSSRAGSRSFGRDPERVVLPSYFNRQVPNAGGGPSSSSYELNPNFIWERQHTFRVETRFRSGNEVDVIVNAIVRNLGQWYLIGGNYFVLSGDSAVEYNGGTQTRVDYVFETWATHPGVASANTTFQNAIFIPPLNNLEKWNHGVDPTGLSAFVINVPRDQFCGQGSTGGRPALPGFP